MEDQYLQIELKQNEYLDQNPFYIDYGYDNFEDNIQDIQPISEMIEDNNIQHERINLEQLIKKNVKNINSVICLNLEWAMIYYYKCNWMKSICFQNFLNKKSHMEIIGYKNQEKNKFAVLGLGECPVCLETESMLLRNLCGHSFCIICWESQLRFRMRQYGDPLSPCLYSDCQVRISYLLAQQIGKNDKKFNQLYHQTLCRSYASKNKGVKICWSLDCTNCFQIKKPLEITQCKSCNHFICLSCGQERHFPTECYQTPNFKKMIIEPINIIEAFGYKICPKCKQAVQKSSGCNSLVCRCKNQFCYICGQNWFPNHILHGNCYRQQQMRQLEEQRKLKRMDQILYNSKLEQVSNQYMRYESIYQKACKMNIVDIKNQLNNYVEDNDLTLFENAIYVYKLSILFLKYGTIKIFFNSNNQLLKQHFRRINKQSNKIDYFFFQFIKEFLRNCKFLFNANSTGIKTNLNSQSLQLQFKKQNKKMIEAMKICAKYFDFDGAYD